MIIIIIIITLGGIETTIVLRSARILRRVLDT